MPLLKTILPFIFTLPLLMAVKSDLIGSDSGQSSSHGEAAIAVADNDTLPDPILSLFSGDTLETDEAGYAIIYFQDESVGIVSPNSTLFISAEIDRHLHVNTRIEIKSGGLFMSVIAKDNSTFEIMTGSSIVSVDSARFGALSSGFYWVDSGEIEIMAFKSGQVAQLRTGMFAQADEQGYDIVTGQLSESAMNHLATLYKEDNREEVVKNRILYFLDATGQIID
jgi:hypothetical protein